MRDIWYLHFVVDFVLRKLHHPAKDICMYVCMYVCISGLGIAMSHYTYANTPCMNVRMYVCISGFCLCHESLHVRWHACMYVCIWVYQGFAYCHESLFIRYHALYECMYVCISVLGIAMSHYTYANTHCMNVRMCVCTSGF